MPLNIVRGSISYSQGWIRVTFDKSGSKIDGNIINDVEDAELAYIGIVADRKDTVVHRYRLAVKGDDLRLARVGEVIQYAIQGNQAKYREFIALCA